MGNFQFESCVGTTLFGALSARICARMPQGFQNWTQGCCENCTVRSPSRCISRTPHYRLLSLYCMIRRLFDSPGPDILLACLAAFCLLQLLQHCSLAAASKSLVSCARLNCKCTAVSCSQHLFYTWLADCCIEVIVEVIYSKPAGSNSVQDLNVHAFGVLSCIAMSNICLKAPRSGVNLKETDER